MGNNKAREPDRNNSKKKANKKALSMEKKAESINESDSETKAINDSKRDNGSEDVIHTQIIKKDNPFYECSSSGEESVHRNGNGAKMSNESTGEESEEQLLQPREGRRPSERRHSSIATSKDSSPDLPLRSVPVSGNGKKVQILEASKVSEGQGRTFIAYAIKFGDNIVKRRYSDFESLRKVLIKLFPMTLIPPIPEKQSITSYGKAMTNSKSNYILPAESADSVDLSMSVINGPVTKNDEKLIRHRIRMLTSFLNRILKTEEITKTSIIFDFLDPNNKNWNDLMTSSPTISSLPKSVLQCNPIDPTNTTKAHTFLPIPSSSNQLLVTKESQPSIEGDEFTKIENEYKKYQQLLQTGVYKYSRAMTKELNHSREDLKGISSQFAQFSSDESKNESGIAELLSHSSDTYDILYENLENLVGKLHYNINEPLSECVHMATAVRELIHYRKLKVIQRDILERDIFHKRGQLKKFQQLENSNKHIDNMVDNQIPTSEVVNLSRPGGPNSYTGKVMNKFSQLANIIKDSMNYQDQDPTTAVKALEKEIHQLEESLRVANSDLIIITETLKNTELPRFIKERNEELIQVFKNYSKYMKQNAEKNLKIWKELQKQIAES